jgi:membrane fusion protein (multidrug efflux system)
MENKEQQNIQATPVESSVVAKKKESRKNKIRAIISNIIVFLVIGFGLFWLVREYFHIGDKSYTEAAQVEEFINPINTRVSAYIKEIKFIEHQQVKKEIHW